MATDVTLSVIETDPLIRVDLVCNGEDEWNAMQAILMWREGVEAVHRPEMLQINTETAFAGGFLKDQDGINVDLCDGKALYTHLVNLGETLTGQQWVASFFFERGERGEARFTLQREFGQFGETRVLGPPYATNYTGEMHGATAKWEPE